MVFGEIIEPSTRALIDDEFEEYPEYEKPEFTWQGDSAVPADLRTLIFVEGSKITKLFNALILKAQAAHCSLQSGDIKVYKIENGQYIVSYVKKDITTGEIIEEFSGWLKKARNNYAVISDSLSAYQSLNLSEKPETLIRSLSTDVSSVFNYNKLESPNLVSGLGADVLSYSIHTGLRSTLFIVYMDNSPLDSINIHPVVQLLKSLNLPVDTTVSNLNPVASNLYL